MANTYNEGDAGEFPTRHNKRELKVIETAKAYSPADSTDWTTLPGNPSAPNDSEDAFDKIAAAFAEGVAKEVTGVITSAELLAMSTTPKVVIAAPGAGRAIVVDEVELFLDYNSAAYAADADEDLVLRSTTTETVYATWDDADTIIEGTADTRRFHKPQYAATFDPLTIDNESVEFAILTAEWATGDSPLYYRVRYRDVALITG